MTTQTNKDKEAIDTLNAINSWPLMFILGFAMFAILIMQSLWDTISGLYFNYAYEAIIIPYTMYFIFSLYLIGNGIHPNKAKIFTMSIASLCLFLPAFYLLATQQVDFHGMVFSEFNPDMEHLPFSEYLPFIALSALLLPYKDFLKEI